MDKSKNKMSSIAGKEISLVKLMTNLRELDKHEDKEVYIQEVREGIDDAVAKIKMIAPAIKKITVEKVEGSLEGILNQDIGDIIKRIQKIKSGVRIKEETGAGKLVAEEEEARELLSQLFNVSGDTVEFKPEVTTKVAAVFGDEPAEYLFLGILVYMVVQEIGEVVPAEAVAGKKDLTLQVLDGYLSKNASKIEEVKKVDLVQEVVQEFLKRN